jgi:hypothetical protein
MHKVIASLTASAVLGAGAYGIASISPAAAVDNPPTTAAPGAAAGTARGGHGRGQFLETVLDKLVTEGKITQAQADAIIAKRQELGAQRPGRAGQLVRGAAEIAAKTIGITPGQLLDAVQSGKTVAEVAQDHGKTGQAVIDAIVAAANTRIDQAVTAGKLDAARAAQLKAGLPDKVAHFVNETPHRK